MQRTSYFWGITGQKLELMTVAEGSCWEALAARFCHVCENTNQSIVLFSGKISYNILTAIRTAGGNL